MINWLFRKAKQKEPKFLYNLQFKITFPLSKGYHHSTSPINITIPANDEAEAKIKLDKFVVAKMKVKYEVKNFSNNILKDY